MADQEERLPSPFSRVRQQQPRSEGEQKEVEVEVEQGVQAAGQDKEQESHGQRQRHWHCVLLVEQLLDERWFWDNVVRWRPRPKLPLPGPTAPCDDGSSRSIEMMEPLRPRHTPRRSLLQEEARRRFGDIRIQVPDRRLDDVSSLVEQPAFLRDVEEEEEEEAQGAGPGGGRGQEHHRFSEGPAPFPTKQREFVDTVESPGKHLATDALLDSGTTKSTRRRRRDRRRGTRSLTELEIDELRGCMDLGFRPSKDDLTPRVVSMFPRLRSGPGPGPGPGPGSGSGVASPAGAAEGEQAEASPRQQQRLYASQAWLISRPDSPLLNWRVPAPNQPGVDMKKHLKVWVQAVASTVRQEC